MKIFSAFFTLILLHSISFAQVDHWETCVYANELWKYRVGTSEPPTNWNSLSFDDVAWLSGKGSIGYGDGDDSTVIAQTESLYMRRTFTITDTSKIEKAAFHADFDDGFVAYLNGVEITRVNVAGNPPAFNTWASALREARIYDGGVPDAFFIPKRRIKSLLVEGDNVLAIQTHNFDGVASSDMTSLYWLSLAINDTSMDYGPIPDWFSLFEFDTNLPIVKINTAGIPIEDEPSIAGEMGIIWNGEGVLNGSSDSENEFLGNISIEFRGQSSLALFPKKGYAIETKDEDGEDMDVSFLNFPAEEDWVLHGPYSDKTLIRNVLAMQVARSMGQYASRTRLVELMVNENYEGVYVMMEKIKRDSSRVDIANLKAADISGDELTGGYVIKIDKGNVDWISDFNVLNDPGRRLGFQLVSPKRTKIQPEQAAYIEAYVDSFEQAMRNPNVPFGGKRYDQYIDISSFADHFILSELTKDVDAYRISSYMHKDKDSKGGLLKAGPAWDYNIAFGNGDYCNSQLTSGWVYEEFCGDINPFWWRNMFRDDAFKNTAKCRWTDLRQGPLSLDTIFAFIDEKATLLAPVIERNFSRWPVLDQYIWPNRIVTGSYQAEIDSMKGYISRRVAWMDANMFGTCTAASNGPLQTASQFKIYPNPSEGNVNLALQSIYSSQLEVRIWDVLGRKISKSVSPQSFGGKHLVSLNIADLNLGKGMFFIQLLSEGKSLGTERLLIK